MLEMSPEEKFLFDLQGFLVVSGFLSPGEVAALNEAIDANHDRVIVDSNIKTDGSPNLAGTGKRMTMTGLLTLPQPWCRPFRDLLAHPKLTPYLNSMLGRGWKLDHSPQIFIANEDAEGLLLHGHGNNVLHSPMEYRCVNGQMRCGMISLEFHLSPNDAGAGGFCAIPGSHKGNFRVPPGVLRYEQHQELVVNPACEAGDLLIFNEATVHGTLPWKAKHQRRAVLYRYSPKWVHFAGGHFETSTPDWVQDLTEAQRAVLEPAYVYNRPVIDDDGTVSRPRSDFQ